MTSYLPTQQEQQFYTSIHDVNKADKLMDLTQRIRGMKNEHKFDIGEMLVEGKQLVPHGQFGKWLKHCVRMEKRTAQRYIRYYKQLSRSNEEPGYSDFLNFLTPTALEAYGNAGDIVQREVDRLLMNGMSPSTTDIQRMHYQEPTISDEMLNDPWTARVGHQTLTFKYQRRGRKIIMVAEIGYEDEITDDSLFALKNALRS